MDLTSILNKVKSFPGVTGYVIVDKDCNIVHTSLEGNEAITLAAIVIKMTNDGNEIMKEYEDDSVEYLCIRSKKHDILVVPGSLYSFAVLRDPNVNSS